MNIWERIAEPFTRRYDPKLIDAVLAHVDQELNQRDGVTVAEARTLIYSIANGATNHCEHKNEILLRRNTSNGGFQYRRFCCDCGRKTTALPHSQITDDDRVSAVNDDGTYSRLSDEAPVRIKYPLRVMRDAIEARMRERGVALDYYAHLQSPKWREEIREHIHALDDRQCQVCHLRPAQQTHHLDYADTGNELDGQLISICRECHRSVTDNLNYFNRLAASYVCVREGALYKTAKRKHDHYETMKQRIQALELAPDDYSRRITELAQAMEI